MQKQSKQQTNKKRGNKERESTTRTLPSSERHDSKELQPGGQIAERSVQETVDEQQTVAAEIEIQEQQPQTTPQPQKSEEREEEEKNKPNADAPVAPPEGGGTEESIITAAQHQDTSVPSSEATATAPPQGVEELEDTRQLGPKPSRGKETGERKAEKDVPRKRRGRPAGCLSKKTLE